MEHLRICFETVRFLVELGVDLVNIQRVMPNVCQVIARVHRFRFWEISYKRQQHYWFTLPITHFGKILANVNNKFILPILGKFLQMPTRNISSFQDRFISDHWKGKAKKKWMFAVHHFCSNGEENSFQVWGDGTCSHTETQRLKVGTQSKDLCVFTNSAIIHLNYFSRTHFTTFFSIWTTWAASESSGGCAMPCRTLTVWGRLT